MLQLVKSVILRWISLQQPPMIKNISRLTESMLSEDVRKRELAPLQSIRDNYEKTVLSLEPGLDSSYDGIRSENLIEWLISE